MAAVIETVDGRRLAMIAHAKRMGNNDRRVLGRILGEKNARPGARSIYASLLRSSGEPGTLPHQHRHPVPQVASGTTLAVKIVDVVGRVRLLDIDGKNAPEDGKAEDAIGKNVKCSPLGDLRESRQSADELAGIESVASRTRD